MTRSTMPRRTPSRRMQRQVIEDTAVETLRAAGLEVEQTDAQTSIVNKVFMWHRATNHWSTLDGRNGYTLTSLIAAAKAGRGTS